MALAKYFEDIVSQIEDNLRNDCWSELTANQRQDMTTNVQSLRKNVMEIEAAISDIEERLSDPSVEAFLHLKIEKANLQEEINQARIQISELEKTLAEITEYSGNRDKKWADLEAQLNTKTAKNLKKENRALKKELAELKDKYKHLQNGFSIQQRDKFARMMDEK